MIVKKMNLPASLSGKTCCLILLLLALSHYVVAQSVSISSDGSDPNANAMLDVQNPSSGDGKGLLIPQVTEAQRTTADASLAGGLLDSDGNLRGGVAAQGLLVYQTDGTEGFYYNTSTTTTPSWIYLVASSSASTFTSSSVDIEGGTIDGTAIGSTTTSTGSFTSVTASDDNAYYLGSDKVLHRGNNTLTGNLVVGDGGGSLSNSSSTEGYYNTFVGLSAGSLCATGHSNCAIGYQALLGNFSGSQNTVVGVDALSYNDTGSKNTAIGYNALMVSTVDGNSAVGYKAMASNTTGDENVAVGYCAMYNNTEGEACTAVGSRALQANTSGFANTALGRNCLMGNTTGGYNNAFGYSTLSDNTTGAFNCGFGALPLNKNTEGNYNVGMGYVALNSNTTGSHNVGIGYNTLYDNKTSSRNVALGSNSLKNTTGQYNCAVGYGSGSTNTSGSNNTYIGCSADAGSDSLSNATALGYQATVDASNKVVIGNSSVTTIGGYADWSNYSDRREKKEITDCKIGLGFIEKLRPVNFKYTNQDKLRNGFIAQEVEDVCNETGAEFGGLTKPQDKNGRYMLSYGEFVVPLVNAAKELKTKNEALEAEVKDLKTELNAIKKKLGM